MKIQRSQSYPVSLETLAGIFTSEEFYRVRNRAAENSRFAVDSCVDTDHEFSIVISRGLSIPLDKVPALVRKFVKGEVTLLQEFRWPKQPPYIGQYRFSLKGVPVEVKGQMTLAAEAGGASQSLVAEVICNVPLVGGKLAALAGEHADKGLDADYRGTLRYLESHGLLPS